MSNSKNYLLCIDLSCDFHKLFQREVGEGFMEVFGVGVFGDVVEWMVGGEGVLLVGDELKKVVGFADEDATKPLHVVEIEVAHISCKQIVGGMIGKPGFSKEREGLGDAARLKNWLEVECYHNNCFKKRR